MFIVTGAPRSGTGYAAKVFQKAGYDVRHEYYGREGICSWLHLYDLGKVYWLDTAYKLRDYDVILHQLRDPLKTISSMTAISDQAVEIIERIIGRKVAGGMLRRAMSYWIELTERAAKRAQLWYRVENMMNVWTMIEEKINIRRSVFPGVDKKTNARDHRDYTVGDLYATDREMADRIIEMANYYGYNL